jgi:regulation of enolase protein 1 (concanavalin A-like superfamily)
VAGSGANIWDTADQFHFASRQVSGDVVFTARVTAFDTSNEWAKAGIMIRTGDEANARNVFLLTSPGLGVALQQRVVTGGTTTRTSGGSSGPPVWMRIMRAGNRFSAYRSADGQSWTAVGAVTIDMPSTVEVGLAVTSRDPGQIARATFESVSVEASATEEVIVPGEWVGTDIGNPSRAGTSSATSGTYTVSGAGADIWGPADQFHFMYRQVSGDVEIIARVAGLQNPYSLSKFGVMFRESLAAGARNAFMAGSGGSGWGYQRRISTGGQTYFTAGPGGTAPGWVKLVREGNLFSAYHSADGSTWRLVGTDTIAMASAVYVGLAVTSHNTSNLTTATFTNVTLRDLVSGNQPPTVTLTAPGAGASYTAPATIGLTASAADADGSISRVEFYRGSTLIGSDTSSPYSASWSSAPEGSYSLTAVAIDNEGARTTSPAVTVTVAASSSQGPTVAITSPSQGATFTAPATITVVASASDSDGIARVDLYAGSTLLRSDTTYPYSVTSNNVAAGTYQLTAIARDNTGATRTSEIVTITVNSAGNQLPNVALTSPASGASFTAPANVTIQATASDSDGSIARVEFYRGSTFIGSDTTSPYSATWSNAPSGSYTLTARAFDNTGASRTSAGVNISVNSSTNQPPTVAITGPPAGAGYTAPASIAIAATASDSDGTISRVDFYVGSQLIGTDSSAPYTATWANVGAGSYSLTAVARDNGGATRTSTAIPVTVSAVTAGPTSVAFSPSADHSTNVTSYTVVLYRSSDPVTAAPVATRDLGKPSPSGGTITVDISTLVNPLAAGSYYAVVRAVGPGGITASTPSASFTK